MSTAEDEAQSRTLIGPVTSMSASSGGVWKTSDVAAGVERQRVRAAIELGAPALVEAAGGHDVSAAEMLPPIVGTGSCGSKR